MRTLVILEPTILKRVGESYLYKRETAQFETREMETVLLSLSIWLLTQCHAVHTPHSTSRSTYCALKTTQCASWYPALPSSPSLGGQSVPFPPRVPRKCWASILSISHGRMELSSSQCGANNPFLLRESVGTLLACRHYYCGSWVFNLFSHKHPLSFVDGCGIWWRDLGVLEHRRIGER